MVYNWQIEGISAVGTDEIYVWINFPQANISLIFLDTEKSVDTGATYSENVPEIPHFPSGDRPIKTLKNKPTKKTEHQKHEPKTDRSEGRSNS